MKGVWSLSLTLSLLFLACQDGAKMGHEDLGFAPDVADQGHVAHTDTAADVEEQNADIPQVESGEDHGANGNNEPSPDLPLDIIAWVPSWGSERWQPALTTETGPYTPANTLTGVAAQFFVCKEDGSVSFDPTATETNLKWVKNYCKSNEIKFILCVHNNDGNSQHGGWNWQLAHEAFGRNKDTHIDALVALVETWEADGLDIDYEGFEDEESYRAEYADFIKTLGRKLHAKGKTLSVDVLPYIWNQPNIEWIGDWIGHVDLINPMTYESGGESEYEWNTYKWQQDTALAAGYSHRQYMVGMASHLEEWGQGGLGTSVLAHIEENLSGDYNAHPAPISIWSGMFESRAWRTPQVWEALHRLRNAPD
jgi:hypothetical protein